MEGPLVYLIAPTRVAQITNASPEAAPGGLTGADWGPWSRFAIKLSTPDANRDVTIAQNATSRASRFQAGEFFFFFWCFVLLFFLSFALPVNGLLVAVCVFLVARCGETAAQEKTLKIFPSAASSGLLAREVPSSPLRSQNKQAVASSGKQLMNTQIDIAAAE